MDSVVRRSVVLLLTLAVLLLGSTAHVSAIIHWCKTDPVVEIDSQRAHIYVSGPEEILTVVTGPTEVRITVPTGISHELISTDNGFGQGYVVEFAESDDLQANNGNIQITVDVMVPASAELPIKVEITDRQDNLLKRKTGETNDHIVVATRL